MVLDFLSKRNGLELRVNEGSSHLFPKTPHIDGSDMEDMARTLNGFWDFVIEADQDMMETRLSSPHPILALYGSHWDDKKKRVPLVFLETVLTRTEGDPDRIPKHYNLLTNSGNWPTSVPEGYDTLILTDLTKADIKKVPKSYVSRMIELAIEQAAKDHSIQSVFTYSPHVEGVLEKVHRANGANDTDTIIRYARAPERYCMFDKDDVFVKPSIDADIENKKLSLSNPGMVHVRAMDYSEKLKSYRDQGNENWIVYGFRSVVNPLKMFRNLRSSK